MLSRCNAVVGAGTSICTSNRPGRSRAGSMRFAEFVSPTTSVGTGSSSTPSILARSWFTTESRATPESACAPPPPPRARAIASNSSSTIMCSAARPRSLSRPGVPVRNAGSSGGGSSNSARTFSSLAPTNRSITSGPDTTVTGRAGLRIRPSVRASRVLPHPGGPCRRRPRMGRTPSSSRRWGGAASGIQTRRRICARTSSRPPTPSAAPEKAVPEPARAISSEERPRMGAGGGGVRSWRCCWDGFFGGALFLLAGLGLPSS
mmetsp:Transcript_7678/g.15968  ORF Transcript_7678/g.15968 Transcript_7678/m.15968 type:complete len:262 (+) Transcript_7678:718-1503(+)